MTAQVSSTAKAPVRANNPAGDGWTFRADDPASLEMDLHQLDTVLDRLKGADLTPYRDWMGRMADNFADLLEPKQ